MIRNLILGLIAIAAGWFVYELPSIKGQAELGSAYAAHITCSCRYIAGRDIKSCVTDFEPGMELVSVEDDPEHQHVQASVLFLAKAVAEKKGDSGCQQLNAQEIANLE